MTRSAFFRELARRTGIPATTLRALLEVVVAQLTHALAAGQIVSLPGLGRFRMAVQNRRVPCVLTGQQGVRRYPTFRPSSSFKGAVVRGERHLAALKKRRERREAAAPVHGGNIPTVTGVHEFRDPVMILGDLQELGATDVDPADELPRDADLQLLAALLEREVNHGSTRTDWSGGSGAGAPGAQPRGAAVACSI